MFNFSTSQTIIEENVGNYFNLSIVKIGQNEANVTIKIEVSEVLGNTRGMHRCTALNFSVS